MGRKSQSVKRCKRNQRTAPKTPPVISDSIFALALAEKPGIEIAETTGHEPRKRLGEEQDDYYKMYNDLLASLNKALWLVKKERAKVDPLKSGLGIGASLAWVLEAFEKNILPERFLYNIDRDGDTYYFTIFKECAFPDFWHALEIKNIVKRLKRLPVLHELFLDAIAFMCSRFDIPTWYDGGCGFSDYAFEERVERWEEEYGIDPECEQSAFENARQYAAAKKCLESYKAGEAKAYERIIQARRPCSKEKILKQLAKLSKGQKRSKVVRFITEMMIFSEEPGCLGDYHYPGIYGEDGCDGLSFDRQVVLVWDWDDEYTALEMEVIDVDAANYGTIGPIAHCSFSPHSTKSFLDKLQASVEWPQKFSELWEKYSQLALSYKPQKKDR